MKKQHFPWFVATASSVAAGLLLTAAHAEAYSGLYVFGDSVSGSGNVALAIGAPTGVPQVITGNSYIPDRPYFASGRFSNGPVWVENFGRRLGLNAGPSLGGGTDYAFGGARTGGPDVPSPTLTTQTAMFLDSTHGTAPADALYVIAEVGNDARDAIRAIASGADPTSTLREAAADYAANLGAIIDSLQFAGARHFLVFDNVNLGVAPAITAQGGAAAGLATMVTSAMNAALALRLTNEAGVTTFDTFSLLTGVVTHPSAYGFSNATDACGALVGADCSRYVFWDGIHPTAAFHKLVAEAAFAAAVPEPHTWALLALGLVGVGSIRYRLNRKDEP